MTQNSSSKVPEVLIGRVAYIFDDDFDVDYIIGPQNIKSYDPDFLRSVCMKLFEDDFASKTKPGDILVGGQNFGYGHPHYPAMIAVRTVGIVAVVAESFSPGFWRGETYNGMPLITCPGITKVVQRWDTIEVYWKEGVVLVPERGVRLQGQKPSARTIEKIEAGGNYQLLLRQYGKSAA